MNPDEFVIVGYIRCAEPGCQRRATAIMRRADADFPYLTRKIRQRRGDGGGREMVFYEPREMFKIMHDAPNHYLASCSRCGWLDVDADAVWSAFREGTEENPREVHAAKRRAC